MSKQQLPEHLKLENEHLILYNNLIKSCGKKELISKCLLDLKDFVEFINMATKKNQLNEVCDKISDAEIAISMLKVIYSVDTVNSITDEKIGKLYKKQLKLR